jgi:hypothetical protein
MRSCNRVELRVVAPDDDAVSGADVYDFCSRQTESSRLRRIEVLEYENELLRRTASAIQIQLIRCRKSGGQGRLDTLEWMWSHEE